MPKRNTHGAEPCEYSGCNFQTASDRRTQPLPTAIGSVTMQSIANFFSEGGTTPRCSRTQNRNIICGKSRGTQERLTQNHWRKLYYIRRDESAKMDRALLYQPYLLCRLRSDSRSEMKHFIQSPELPHGLSGEIPQGPPEYQGRTVPSFFRRIRKRDEALRASWAISGTDHPARNRA